MDIGPLNPEPAPLLVGLVCFFVVFGVFAKVLLPRISRVLAQREAATVGLEGKAAEVRAQAQQVYEEYQELLAQARHEAARLRQESAERGAVLIAELRAEGQRQRDEMVAASRARLAADRELAQAALRVEVDVLAVELAGRIVGESLEDFARDR